MGGVRMYCLAFPPTKKSSGVWEGLVKQLRGVECGLDYDLNLSLITSEALIEIHTAFQVSTLDEFPYKILLRDVLIDSNRVVRSISK